MTEDPAGVAGTSEQLKDYAYKATMLASLDSNPGRRNALLKFGEAFKKAADALDQLRADLEAERANVASLQHAVEMAVAIECETEQWLNAERAAKEAAERTVRSVAAMLGWDSRQYLPRETLERDIAALKSRAQQVTALQAQLDAFPPAVDSEQSVQQFMAVFDRWRKLLPTPAFTHGQGVLFQSMVREEFHQWKATQSQVDRQGPPQLIWFEPDVDGDISVLIVPMPGLGREGIYGYGHTRQEALRCLANVLLEATQPPGDPPAKEK